MSGRMCCKYGCHTEHQLRVLIQRSEAYMVTTVRRLAGKKELRPGDHTWLANVKEAFERDKATLAQHVEHCSDCKRKA